MSKKYGIIILAAGGSLRLGRPKQLLRFKGKSLLENVLLAAAAVPGAETLVVLGANKDEVESTLKSIAFDRVYNPHWESGMASSITTGLKTMLQKHPDLHACLITVCDQPFVNSGILAELVVLHENSRTAIVASSYQDTVGTPALFGSRYFPELLALRGDEGAKKIITSYPDDIALAPFELGKIDIDTEEDYRKLEQEY